MCTKKSKFSFRTKVGVFALSIKSSLAEGGMPMEEPMGSKRGTFVVRVLYQQNNTWQGEVLWAERNERQNFRSTLELMKFMDSALEEHRGEQEKSRKKA